MQLLGCSGKLLGSCYAVARVFWEVSREMQLLGCSK